MGGRRRRASGLRGRMGVWSSLSSVGYGGGVHRTSGVNGSLRGSGVLVV